jgi:hypothetical protein
MGYVECSSGVLNQRQLSGFKQVRHQEALEKGSNLYIRLTCKGGQQIRAAPLCMKGMTQELKRKTSSNNLSLRYLSVGTIELELVAYLKAFHSLNVRKACVDTIRSDCKFAVGHVELETPLDAERMQYLSARGNLVHEARSIDTSADNNVSDWESYCSTILLSLSTSAQEHQSSLRR